MTGATITVDFRLGHVSTAIYALMAAGHDPQPLLRAIGVGLVRNAQDRFDAETDPDGNRWAPLHPAYLPHKRGAGILRGSAMRGGLQGSIVSQVSGRELAIGSNKIYAAVHQFGATIVPKKPGGRLVLRTASGRAWAFAKEVTIPARPYLGLSSRDVDTILDVTEIHLSRTIAGAVGRRG